MYFFHRPKESKDNLLQIARKYRVARHKACCAAIAVRKTASQHRFVDITGEIERRSGSTKGAFVI